MPRPPRKLRPLDVIDYRIIAMLDVLQEYHPEGLPVSDVSSSLDLSNRKAARRLHNLTDHGKLAKVDSGRKDVAGNPIYLFNAL